jgi:hypothetical protein
MRRTGLIALLSFATLTLTTSTTVGAQASDGLTRADQSVRTDLKILATEMETFLTDNGVSYPTAEDVHYDGVRSVQLGELGMTLGAGNRLQAIKVTEDGVSGYCLRIERADKATDTTRRWRWTSGGGIGTGACPDRFTRTSYPLPK